MQHAAVTHPIKPQVTPMNPVLVATLKKWDTFLAPEEIGKIPQQTECELKPREATQSSGEFFHMCCAHAADLKNKFTQLFTG